MSKSALELASDLLGHYRRLDSTRRKLEKLFKKGHIKRHDIEQVYVGLYLDSIVSFERFVEELFLGLLAKRIAGPKKIHPRVEFRSDGVAREVVFGGKNYVDWFPYDFTVKRSEAFFRSGLPFTILDKSEKKTIEGLMAIRNALAHKSRHSLKIFEDNVLGSLPLVGHERAPAGYLRSLFRISPDQTRYENLIIEMAQIAKKLAVCPDPLP